MTTLDVVAGPHAELLPCVAANLSTLLAHAGVADVLTALGGPCGMVAEPPTVLRLGSIDPSDWIRRCTGLHVARSADLSREEVAAIVRSLVESGSPALVFADAYSVPWSPYRGREHHEHAFVVDGVDDGGRRLHVFDAYTNVTRYGRADPCRSWVDTSDLLDAVGSPEDSFTIEHLAGTLRETVVESAEVLDLVKLNVATEKESRCNQVDSRALTAYVSSDATPEALGWLALATWLVCRSRRLHVLWWESSSTLASLAPTTNVAEIGSSTVVPAWAAAQTVAYLAWRRVQAGRVCPPSLEVSLARAAAAERDWFAAMQTWLNDVDG